MNNITTTIVLNNFFFYYIADQLQVLHALCAFIPKQSIVVAIADMINSTICINLRAYVILMVSINECSHWQ